MIYSSPTIGPDGTIFIGSNDNLLHAFNPDGSTKWTFTTSNWVDSTAALSTDGTLYVGSWDNKLYAIDSSNGIKSWEFETNSYVVSSPAMERMAEYILAPKIRFFTLWKATDRLPGNILSVNRFLLPLLSVKMARFTLGMKTVLFMPSIQMAQANGLMK